MTPIKMIHKIGSQNENHKNNSQKCFTKNETHKNDHKIRLKKLFLKNNKNGSKNDTHENDSQNWFTK